MAGIPSGAVALAVEDLDGDAMAEVVVGSPQGVVRVFTMVDGVLAEATSVSTNTALSDVVIVDLDANGTLDLVASVEDGAEGAIQAIVHDGSLGFDAEPATVVGGARAIRLTVGDTDADELPEIVVPDYGGMRVSIWSPDETVGFVQDTEFAVGQRPRHVGLADFDGDGLDDALVSQENCYGGFEDPDGYCDEGQVALAYNEGGAFSVVETANVGAFYPSVSYGSDFDLDGQVDALVITRNCTTAPTPECFVGRVSLFSDVVDGSLGQPIAVEDPSGNLEAARGVVADLDADGNHDAVFVMAGPDLASGHLALLLAADEPVIETVPIGPYGFRAAAGDVNGDGALDVVVSHFPDTSLSFLIAEP